MKFLPRFVLLGAVLMVVMLAGGRAAAQAPPPATTQAVVGPLQVYLVTFGPGNEVWEKFGHNAIWILDTNGPYEVLYNWGVFDFGEGLTGFLSFTARFIQGKLWYAMEGDHEVSGILEAYALHGRSVLVQELNIPPAAAAAMLERLRAKDTDENRHYLYDYYRANCSTKTRDAIDEAVGGRVKTALAGVPTGTTYRWHTRRLTAGDPVLYFALYFILGHPVDRPLSAWEESFLPAKLSNYLKTVKVPGEGGRSVSLVKSEQLAYAGIIREPAAPPETLFTLFLGVGVGLGVLMLVLALFGYRYAPPRWGFDVAAVAWSLVAGIGGCLALWGWFFTDHTACRYNENVLQATPLSLLLVVLTPAARRWRRQAVPVALAVAGLSLLGLALKMLPGFFQVNREVIALVLPAHLGLAAAVIVLSRRPLPRRADDDEDQASDDDDDTDPADDDDEDRRGSGPPVPAPAVGDVRRRPGRLRP